MIIQEKREEDSGLSPEEPVKERQEKEHMRKKEDWHCMVSVKPGVISAT